MANAVVPAKSYMVETGDDVLGVELTHHFVEVALSYALATTSALLQADPVPVAAPPSVRSGLLLPQTLAVPPPPQVFGEVHVPHEFTVRDAPQLSFAVTVPQFFASRVQ